MKNESPNLSKSADWRQWALLILLLVGMMYGQNLSGDVWWHLKTGQWIVEHKALPFDDPFSYTAKNPVVLHEWGAEVVSWVIYKYIASWALAVFSALLIVAAFAIAFALAVKKSGSSFAAFVVTAAGAAASAGGSEMRPQVYSFLLFAVLMVLLEKWRKSGGRAIWAAVPLIFVWANLHGAFLVGIVVIVIELVAAIISPPGWARQKPNPRLAAAVPIVGVLVLSLLAALVNPNGVQLYVYPLKVLGGSSNTTKVITEWMRPSLNEWTGRALVVLIGLGIVGMVVGRRKVELRDAVCFVFFALAAVVSRRQAVFLSIACAAPIAAWLSGVDVHMRASAKKVLWAILALLVVVLFGWRMHDAWGRSPFDYMNKSEVFPSEACDYILHNKLNGNMFNDYNYGGYLIWRLWPRHKVFVDGRLEPFVGGALEEEYAATNGDEMVWRRIVKKYDIGFAVVNPDVPLAEILSNSPDWDMAYGDEKALVFLRIR